ncbi:MAG: hypothetical protein ACUZ8I_00020 [Candidatus Scalindua sp.]
MRTSGSENKCWRRDNAHLLTPFMINCPCIIKTKKIYYKEARKPRDY